MSDPNVQTPSADEDAGTVNWDEINQNVLPGADADFEPSPGAVAAATGGQPPVAAPAPVPAAPAAPATPAVPATPPVEAAPPVAPPTPAPVVPPQPAPQTAEQIREMQQQFATKLNEELTTRFSADISEDDTRDLVVNPEKVLPKLMSRAAMAGMEMAIGMMQQQLPQLIRQQTAQHITGSTLEQQFYATNADLKAHSAIVNKMVAVAKTTLEPGASTEAILQEAADLARRRLKLTPPAPAAEPTPPAAPARPFAPAKGGGARSGPAPAASGPSKPEDIWSKLAEDD